MKDNEDKRFYLPPIVMVIMAIFCAAGAVYSAVSDGGQRQTVAFVIAAVILFIGSFRDKVKKKNSSEK